MSTPTVKDIAKLAGVSTGTVDRVLHKRGRVAADTVRRVNDVARELGFQINPHASNLARTRTFAIAVVMPEDDQDAGYWRLPAAGMQDAIRELHPYQVHLRSCSFKRGSTRSFLRATESLVADPPDALALAPVLPEEAHQLVERLPSHIPICCFDTELPGGRASYVGQDAHASGRLAAKLMRLLLAPATSPVIIQPVAEDVHIRGRVEGFLAGFPGRGGGDAKRGGEAGGPGFATRRGESATPGGAETRGRGTTPRSAGGPGGDANRGGKAGGPAGDATPGVTRPGGAAIPGVVANRRVGATAEHSIPLFTQPMPDAGAAREVVSRVFAEHADVGGVFVTNALVHLVAQELGRIGRGDVPLVGYDVLPENRKLLETGAIDFLISQRPQLQGKRAITLLFEALQRGGAQAHAHEWPVREIMPLDMVTAENIGYYIDL